MERAGDRKGSVGLWEQARAVDPNHPETLFALCRRYMDSGEYPIAALAAQRLAGLPDWRDRADELLGSIHLAQHDAAGTAACWQRTLDHRLAQQGGDRVASIRNRPGARTALPAATRPGSTALASRAGLGTQPGGILVAEPRTASGRRVG